METIDLLGRTGFRFYQAKAGYRCSLDPVLLCDFARIASAEKIADLGTGNGVIPLLLTAKMESIRILGFEIQPSLAERARRNVSLNNLEGRVEIIQGDLKKIRDFYLPQKFDVIISNPPFRPAGSGKVSTGDERRLARHEIAGGLDDFLAAAAYLLRNRGSLFMVHLPERLVDLLSGMRAHAMEPKRLRFVHSRPGEGARLVLAEAGRMGRPGLNVEPPLYIYDGDEYSEEMKGIYRGFSCDPV